MPIINEIIVSNKTQPETAIYVWHDDSYSQLYQ